MSIANRFVKELIAKDFFDPFVPQHQKGPDYIIPAENHFNWRPEGAVKLKEISEKPGANIQPESVVTFFQNIVKKAPDHVAMVINRENRWLKWTNQQYLTEVRAVAKGFIKLGLIPYHGIGILASNSPEWMISHFAGIFAGGFSAGIYTTNSPDACFHVLNDCEANIVIVDNEVQLDKILRIRDKLPHLKAIVQFIGQPQHSEVISWEELISIGRSVPENILDARIKGLAINQCCFLVYTSGTTGNAKGTMMTHDNVVFSSKYFTNVMRRKEDDDTVKLSNVSFLPMSHIAGLFGDGYLSALNESTVFFAPPDALKGNLLTTLKEAKPTVFAGVPRVYEKIFDKMNEVQSQMPSTKRNLFNWAKEKSLKYHTKEKSKRRTIKYYFAKKFILEKVKKVLGLERATYFMCGGAPIANEILEFFLSLDMFIIEAYGLSETTSVHISINRDEINFGSVGNKKTFSEYEIKIKDPDEKECGEILLLGRNVFMGYLKMEDETKKCFDNDGWFHSGDLGILDRDGYLFITGRIKELLITSGGENIPPILIEEKIKKLLPIVSNAMLIGDRKKYLTMLLTLKTELDLESLVPTDDLTFQSVEWCRSVGSNSTTVSQILDARDKRVMDAIQKGIDEYNDNDAISHAQRIQKWIILPQDFSIPNGELGPSTKMKRFFILEKYSQQIQSMY